MDYVRCLYEQSNSSRLEAKIVVSYILGVCFGRWDIRYTLRKDAIEIGEDDFTAPPFYQPGALVDSSFKPASTKNIISTEWIESRVTIVDPAEVAPTVLGQRPEVHYPIEVVWDGIIPDDPGHPHDVVNLICQCQEVIVGNATETTNSYLAELLGQPDLRSYFRSLGKDGFWDDHLTRYSKGRRKAPIYWLLQSSKKNYNLWLYYHRLDRDLLFKALMNYVEPKIRLEHSRLETIRAWRTAAGETGKEAKQLAKETERQEDFLSELQDFEDKLRRAANLHLEPDLNDGVVLNIAPLHELVPWKAAKSYWDELLKGEYEWSSISKQLRQKGLVN